MHRPTWSSIGSGRKRLGSAGLIVALVALAGSAAYAAIPQNGVYTGCYVKSTGALRVIDGSEACRSTETKMTWSKTGPAGPIGPKGPQGDPGPASNEVPALDDIGSMRITGLGFDSDEDIPFASFEHQIISPRDAASGLATGRRQHKPMTIVKYIDKASPLLAKAIATGQTLPSVLLSVKRDPTDASAYWTYTLTNAQLALVHEYSTPPQELEEVSFTYQKIVWTYVDGGITFEDDWEAPEV